MSLTPRRAGWYPRSVRADGKISIPNALALIGVSIAIYFAVLFVPVYLDHLDIVSAVREAHSKAVVLKNTDYQLRAFLKETASRVGNHWEVNEQNVEEEYSGLGLTDDDITIERGEDGYVAVTVTYERRVTFFPLKSFRVLHLSSTKEGTREYFK